MQFRSEVKHPITPGDKASLCAALRTVAKPDPHAGERGQYAVRSLYFDNLQDKALREKLDGVSRREKFRIRYYDDDLTFIRLEKKVKRGDMGRKISCGITAEEVARILRGDTAWMPASGRALIVELYGKMKGQGLRPRTIVTYTRTPFVYAPGNVRVTIDEDIRLGMVTGDFLNPHAVTIPVREPGPLLEVKWDDFLPGPIRKAVQLKGRRACAYSKYAACRIYG